MDIKAGDVLYRRYVDLWFGFVPCSDAYRALWCGFEEEGLRTCWQPLRLFDPELVEGSACPLRSSGGGVCSSGRGLGRLRAGRLAFWRHGLYRLIPLNRSISFHGAILILCSKALASFIESKSNARLNSTGRRL